MPFLRFTRDKRGYETTSLVYAGRRDGRSRQRILYWFRTPPGVKVGRPALDEEAIRWIEEHNPDIEFDWPKILEAQPTAAPPADDARTRRPRRDRNRPRPPRSAATQSGGAPQGDRPKPPSAELELRELELPELELSELEHSEPEPSESEFSEPTEPELAELEPLELEPLEPEPLEPEPLEPEPLEPEPLEPLEPEVAQAFEQLTHPEVEEKIAPPAMPVEQNLGREQLTRLRARYAELLARITERGGDNERVDALRAQAESLNPDTWVTDEEVRQGLESFEPKIRDLRAALGLRRRRRSRRGGRRRRGAPPESPGAPDDEPDDEKDDEKGEE